jgi:hypothetical protein
MGEEVLSTSLRPFERAALELVHPPMQRRAGVGGGRQLQLATGESKVQAASGAMDGVAFGHSMRFA